MDMVLEPFSTENRYQFLSGLKMVIDLGSGLEIGRKITYFGLQICKGFIDPLETLKSTPALAVSIVLKAF